MRKLFTRPDRFGLTKGLVIAAVLGLVLLGGVCYYCIQPFRHCKCNNKWFYINTNVLSRQ